ncbi:uroporphyrinogen III synthase [Afipia sp. P52-10]|uniref:uroporphyrinogen-III synthase n=1 Tax=Afipia sp. P52-10 TaxID=1429916 RepID=UPI0003DF0FA0|nr:uroporphyrinogen-III synthase [Afipia sp. P52-10]ETR77894.1 uroporphyrinogen III synthase [Afipia sp. P52-10]
MSILVTRPAPDNAITAAALSARGFKPLLAPVLLFQALPFRDDEARAYDGVILTSTNALRAMAQQPMPRRLRDLPVFAVGERTAQAAREASFTDVRSADGDAVALRDLILASLPQNAGKSLLYLSAAEISRDLGKDLAPHGIAVIRLPVYRMTEALELPPTASEALAHHEVRAILHYSRRSALAFIKAVRLGGLEISALALPQVCLSELVAGVLRDAGANRLAVADAPHEPALLDMLQRVLPRTGSH